MEQHIAEVYADYLMVPLFDMVPSEVDPKLAGLLPEKLCREHFCVPVELHGGTLDVAFATFDDMLMVDELQLLTSLNIRPMIGPLSIIDDAIEALFRRCAPSIGHLEGYREESDDADEAGFEEEQNEEILDIDVPPPPGPDGRIVRMVNQVLQQALRSGASDIHIEPFEDSCAIRLRVDGSLQQLPSPPRSQFVSMVSRFKILAKMDIAEKRVPQDGAIARRRA